MAFCQVRLGDVLFLVPSEFPGKYHGESWREIAKYM